MIDQKEINKAVETLRSGGLVAVPTETVYGLGADASNADAVAKIFAAKGRPADHPLIVHLADVDQLVEWARDIPDAAYRLAKAFWPGPLTLILKKQSGVLDVVTGGQDTVGLRVPNHPVAKAVLQAFDGGIAAPSANRFAHISPTDAKAVYEELGNNVDVILDGGECDVGLESTIIDLSANVPVLLRPGMIAVSAIESVLEVPVTMRKQQTVRAPGMHHVHYAPTTPTVMATVNDILTANQHTAVVTWSDVLVPDVARHVKMANNAGQYAHDLYHVLRELDHVGAEKIMIEAVPDKVEWDAIRDRLNKASAK